MNEPQWLLWSRQLQAIAQTGLTFARDPFDIERYEAIRALAGALVPRAVNHPATKRTSSALNPVPGRLPAVFVTGTY